ncbi:MAG TPA: hypothetical protein VFH29_06540, partial [Anaerolineales bacterium]|nr:hypothetical protein [Anaerolineales bacterium]
MTGPGEQKAASSGPAVRVGLGHWLLICCLVLLLAGSVSEFYAIAAGTGTWYADFSLRWFGALVVFTTMCAGLLLLVGVRGWRIACTRFLITLRARIGDLRIVITILAILVPLLLFQYTPWGVVFRGPYLRLLVWGLCVGGLAWLLCPSGTSLFSTRSIAGALLLSGAALVVGAALTYVTDYPFSLGWSEGNRLWDYSLMFGKSLYVLGPDVHPAAYLDVGRQLLGGLPFLFPNVSIVVARCWLAAVATVPYALLGMLAFRPMRRRAVSEWLAGGLFSLLFLSQGPIHAPLVMCAIMVLLGRRLTLHWGMVVLVFAGFFAAASRFTWMFAPAMWIVMLEMGGAEPHDHDAFTEAWHRAIALGFAGLLGSAVALSGILNAASTSEASSVAGATSQALLWYRLLPNATYGDGIVLGMLKATGPLIAVVVLARITFGKWSRLQLIIMGGSLLAFLVVGLVVSTKIGGGGDLHNLDMFLVGLVFTVALLWDASGGRWFEGGSAALRGLRGALLLSLFIPASGALMSLQPISFSADADWISVLVGAERPRDLGSLPDKTTTNASIDQIRTAVAAARGPVLFMDQRQ